MGFKKNFVLFSITNFCNAKCKSCSFWKTKNPTFPKREELEETIINIRNKLNCGFLEITGGEPLTYPYIFEAIKLANKHGMVTQLMTNGSLLDQNKINNLHNAGLKFLSISVDHYDTNKLEANRGIPGLLSRIKKNVNYAKETDMITHGGITITKENVNDLEKIAEYVLSIGFDEVYFCLPIKSTESSFKLGNEDYDVVDFSNKEMVEIVDRLIKIKKKSRTRVAHKLGFLRDMKRYYLNKKQKFSCKGGENIFFVDNDLDLYQCMMGGKLGKINGKMRTLNNVACDKCPLQCFREPSVFYHGIRSLPFLFSVFFHKSYSKIWRIREKLKVKSLKRKALRKKKRKHKIIEREKKRKLRRRKLSKLKKRLKNRIFRKKT